MRLNTYPIIAPDIWQLYKTHMAAFWTAEEIKFETEYEEFTKLHVNEQHFIKMILAFFATSDNIVNLNLTSRFMIDIEEALTPVEAGYEAKVFYIFQSAMENIHSEMYGLLLDTFVRDSDEKNKLINAIFHIPAISAKAGWCKKWTESGQPFPYRLLAFIFIEGIFFSASFCAIYWIKERNILDALTKSNELIARDEFLHCNAGILLYTKYIREEQKLQESDVYAMLQEAVDIETQFITESLPCQLIGMNASQMIQYIKYVGNNILTRLNYKPMFPNAENPFDFMEKISLSKKTNFFDKRVTAYQLASVNNQNKNIETVEDF